MQPPVFHYPHVNGRRDLLLTRAPTTPEAQFKSELKTLLARIAARPHQANLGHTQFIADVMNWARVPSPKQ